MQKPEPAQWALEEWDVPPALPSRQLPGGLRVCPYVGVRLPDRIYSERYFEKYFRHAWYMQDPKIWDMLPFVRDQWFDKILDSWKVYNRRIRFDMTRRFKVQVKKLLAKGGLIAVIGGRPAAQGDGKSIGALMFIDMLREEFGVDVTAHILWEHSHMQFTINAEDTSGYLILDIDEDLTATGEGSKTIMIEISNTWQTNRKPKLIIISVGIDPGHSHPAVNIHLIPAGIWEEYQATRFGMFAGGRFVGWTVLQRNYRPEWQVKYGIKSELSSIDEYDARATAHSRNVLRKGVSAYPAHVEEAHITIALEWLSNDKKEVKDLGMEWIAPTVDVMVTETKQSGLPTKNINYPKRICATALRRFLRPDTELERKRIRGRQVRHRKLRLAEAPMRAIEIVKQHFLDVGLESIPTREEKMLSARGINWSEISDLYNTKDMEQLAKQAVKVAIIQTDREDTKDRSESTREGWQALQDLLFEQTDGSSDALSMCRYYVPIIKKLSYRKLISRYALETNRTTLYDVIDSQFVKLSPTAKGNAAELYVLRQLVSSVPSCEWGGGRKGVADVSGPGWAVAVKAAFREPYEIHAEPMTPENKADVAVCVFIRPRVHRVRLFPVTSPKMTLTGREGSSCGISEIGERLKELIDGA